MNPLSTPSPDRTRAALRSLALLALVVALVLPFFPAIANASVTSGGWSTSATVSASIVAPGDVVSATASVRASKRGAALVAMEIYEAGGARVHQQAWDRQSFSANQQRSFTSKWTAPEGARAGSYVVKIGVFDTGWKALRHWNDAAATFAVVTPELLIDGGHTDAGWTTAARLTAEQVTPGTSVPISVVVGTERSAKALVNLEVYSPSRGRVLQKAWDNESFSAGTARTFTADVDIPAGATAETYAIKIGVFDTGWRSLHHWNDRAGSFTVGAAAPTPNPSEPAPTEPAPTEPAPTEPAPTEPAPTEPTPTGLPPVPEGWPGTVQLGTSSAPNKVGDMLATAPFGFRYQYLAGGVNTGGGWAHWNPDGTFVTNYVNESRKAGVIPVFSYYMLFQSQPGVTMGEPAGVYANLTNNATMSAYFQDLKLFFQRAGAAGGTTVLHVEPDVWAFLQQRATGDDAKTTQVRVGGSGMADVAGLPDTGAGFAQAIVRLRDRYAPNVQLGYHFSTWGTGNDFIYTDPSDAVVQELGRRTARFYQSLGAPFDVTFTELTDRDAGFKEHVYGDRGGSWFNADDYRRTTVYIDTFVRTTNLRAVLWQLPYGNTKMRAMNNTWNHYQDNKVETLLDDASRAQLEAYAKAGVVAYLFGAGAGGATCACDQAGDGVTNPAAINGNTRTSLSADDDGGFFRERAAEYYRSGPMPLPR